MAELITKGELAKRAGVSPSAITKVCRGSVAPAMVGKKIDADHRSVIEYIARHAHIPPHNRGGHKMAQPSRGKYAKVDAPMVEKRVVPANITEYADRTLREIIAEFGTDAVFLDFLRATKEIEVIQERRIKNAKAVGDLVSRELVKRGIIDPVDSMLTRLFTDGSKTITRRATALHDSGKPQSEIEEFVRDQITSFVRPMKARIKRTLKGLK